MLEVVLAGGTGGLGSAAARALARDFLVTASYRANASRAAAVRDIATVVRADLLVQDDRRRLLDSVRRIYGLAVFAGDPVRGYASAEEAMRQSHEANYLGPVLLAREAAERMRAQGTEGSIVLVSTMQAVGVFPNSTAYAAPKAALVHAGRILAKECRGPANIRVNVVCPGVNQAGMAKASIAAGKYDRYLSEGMIHRFGWAEDVARAVRFLLEPDSYITGQVLTIDGGLTL